MPSAPPICWTAFCTPEARLASSTGHPCSDALVIAGKHEAGTEGEQDHAGQHVSSVGGVDAQPGQQAAAPWRTMVKPAISSPFAPTLGSRPVPTPIATEMLTPNGR